MTLLCRFFPAFGVLLLVVFFFGSAFSEEKAVELEGERLIYRLSSEEILVWKGKVTYGDVVLSASEISISLKKEELVARGNVRVTRKDESFQAQEVVYNWGKEWWRFRKVSSDITGSGVQGKLFFWGETVEEEKDTMTIEGARVTSCDLEEPHYFIEARKIIVYPNKKVVLYGLSYWDFGRRLFSIPSYAFFLNRKEQLPFLPMVGYSKDTGYYLNYFYNYFSSDTSFGTVELGWWEKTGWKLGIKHYLEDEGRNEKGWVSLEYLDKKNVPPIITAKGEYSRKFSDAFDLSSSFSYFRIFGQNDETVSAQTLLTYRKGKVASRLGASYNENASQKGDTLSGTWVTSYDLGVAKAEAQVVYRENSSWGAFTDKDLQYVLSLQKSVGKYTYTLRYSGHEDLEGDAYTGDFVSFVRKIPEFGIVRQKERIGKSDFWYQAGLVLGHYFEEDTGVSEDRLNLSLSLEGKSVLSQSATLTPKISLEQNFYGNSFARYVLSGTVTLEERLSPSFSLLLGYNRAWYAGATPFRFDYTTPKTDFWSLGITYEKDPWSVELESGYDAIDGVFQEATLKLGYKESTAKNFEVRGSYDFNEGKWMGMVVSLSWPLSREWNIGLDGGWDLQSGELESLRVRLTRDLHCREISLFYDRTQDTFWVEYGIKAFPGQTVRIGGE
ncbi:MAG: hypothetical protein ACUVTO_08155 [Candidatus Caldatribacteriaceae bacterium]